MDPYQRGQYQRERQFPTVTQIDEQEHRGERPDEGQQEAAEENQRRQLRRPLVAPAECLQAPLPIGALLARAMPSARE